MSLGLAEPVSSLSHYLAALIAFVAAPGLLRSVRDDRVRSPMVTVFVAAAVFLFVASGSFHACEHGSLGREVFRRIDHAAISTMIAGTLTALYGLALPEASRRPALRFVWAIALAGIAFELMFLSELPPWVPLIFYLGLGWVGAIALLRIISVRSWSSVRLIVWGGVAYSLGALLDFAQFPVLVPGVLGPHEVFHFAVCAGALMHWRYIRQLASAHAAVPSAADFRGVLLPQPLSG